MEQIQLTGQDVTLSQVWAVSEGDVEVVLSESSRAAMQKSRDYIEKRIANKDVMYGVNTGFGAFSNVTIPPKDIVQLQKNIIRSHSCGVGEPFTKKESFKQIFRYQKI